MLPPRSVLTWLLLALPLLGQVPAASTPPKLRLGMLGASVSDGFQCQWTEQRADGTYAAHFRLQDMLRLACPELAVTVLDRATGGMGFDVQRVGGEEVEALLAFEPDCVVGVDFLFWYCYGPHAWHKEGAAAEAARLAMLEVGLGELAKFAGTVVIGDIPDMWLAGGKIIPPGLIPPLATIEKANARIAAWAEGRPNVHVLPLSAIVAELTEKGTITVAGQQVTASEDRPLQQRDGLHATPAGLAAIAGVVLDTLHQAMPQLRGPGTFDFEATLRRAHERLQKSPRRASGRARRPRQRPLSNS